MLVCLHTIEKTNKQTLQCSLPKRIFELQTQWIHIYKTVESLIENTIYELCQLEKQEVHRTLATLVSEGYIKDIFCVFKLNFYEPYS